MGARYGGGPFKERLGNICAAVFYQPEQIFARSLLFFIKGIYYIYCPHGPHSHI